MSALAICALNNTPNKTGQWNWITVHEVQSDFMLQQRKNYGVEKRKNIFKNEKKYENIKKTEQFLWRAVVLKPIFKFVLELLLSRHMQSSECHPPSTGEILRNVAHIYNNRLKSQNLECENHIFAVDASRWVPICSRIE